MDAGEAEKAVRAIARAGDRDRYAAALFGPRALRDRLFALIAFNVELARIAEQVTEPQLGEIRLEWWRETLARTFAGEPAGHPVADMLVGVAKAAGISNAAFQPLIDARHFDISVKLMPDTSSLDRYLDHTAGAMFRLAGEMAGLRGADLTAAAASAGLAYGLTGLMRSLPLHLAKGRVDLPTDLLRRHGITPEQLLAGDAGQSLLDALAELRARAQAAIDKARAEMASIPTGAREIFRPLALVEPYLSALGKEDDPLHAVADINPLYRLWRLATYRPR